MKISAKTFFLSTVASGLAVAMPSQAYAQEAATAAEDEDDGVIIVTARKSEEKLLETPLAITTFDAEAIEDRDLQSIEDIQLFTPGFVFEAFATVPGRFDQSPRFRGIDIDTGNPFRQTASVFVDGVYIINGASGVSLNDVERVEVIKGPQSAVFGRNTYGGAVNYISKTPGNDFAFDFSATAATRGEYALSAGVDLPLVPDLLGARVSASFRNKDGHYDNPFIADTRLGDQQTWNFTGSLFFTPSDNLDVKLRAAYFENDDGPPAAGQIVSAQANCGPFPGGSQTRVFSCGELDPDLARRGSFVNVIPDIASRLPNVHLLRGPRSTWGFDRQNLTLSGQFDFDILENLTLSGLAGYSRENTRILTNFGDQISPVFNFFSGNDRQFRMNSQEVRLSGNLFDEFVDWSVGYSRFYQSNTNSGGFITYSGNPVGAGNPVAIGFERVKTRGIFGTLGINLTDELSISAEGRFQRDSILTQANLALPATTSAAFNSFLPRVIVDYQVTPSTLIYANYSEGNLPGGFNPEIQRLSQADVMALAVLDPLATPNFDEENLKNYEVGVKHGFMDNRGSIALAAFLMKRDGQQFRTSVTDPTLNGGTTVTYFLNRGETDIKGFELEANFEVVDGLTLSGSVGYADGEFQVVADTVYAVYFGTQDASGQKAPRYPKWSGSASINFEQELASGLPIFARVDTSYIGRRFFDISNLSYSKAGFITNARIGIKPGDFRIEAFVTNLTNSDIPTGIGRTSDADAFFSQYSYRFGFRDKRQFGIRVSGDF